VTVVTPGPSHLRGWLLFAAMCVIWGLPYLFIKVAVGSFSPASVVLLRTGIAALLLLPVTLARRELRPVLARWRWVLAYTLVEVAIPWWFLSDAERRISSSAAALLVAAVPMAGVLLGLLSRSGERFGVRRLAGLLVGFAGVGVLVGFDISGSSLLGVLEMAVVVAGYATGPMLVARYLQGVPSTGVVAVSVALPALGFAIPGILSLPHALPGLRVVLSVLALGVICTALAFLLFFALIAELGSVRATVITYVNPAVAVLLGVALLHEPLTLGIAGGLVLILAGSFLAARPGRVTAAAPRRQLARDGTDQVDRGR
jgi:drug/metabolite transporter (DMT)-like permease